VPVGAIMGAATIGGAAIASNASGRQVTAATNTANQNNALQASIFNQQRADLAPWRASGTAALAEINRRLGLGGAASAVAPRDGGGTPLIGAGAGGVAPTVSGVSGVGGGSGGYGVGGMGSDQRDVAQFAPSMMADDKSVMPQATGTNVLSTDGGTGPQVLPGVQGPTMTGTASGGAGPNALDPENRYGGFYASPGYQFRFDEGQRGINANRAASGSLQSGDAMRALTRYGQDYASNEFNTQLNQLFSVAGLGQTATGQGNALAGQYGAQVGQNNQNASNALQSSYGTQANAWGNALGNIGGNIAYNWPTGGATGGQNPPSDLWGLF
jgi:hypothetical protein